MSSILSKPPSEFGHQTAAKHIFRTVPPTLNLILNYKWKINWRPQKNARAKLFNKIKRCYHDITNTHFIYVPFPFFIFWYFHHFIFSTSTRITQFPSPIAKLAFPLPLSEVSNNCEIVSNYNQKFNFKLLTFQNYQLFLPTKGSCKLVMGKNTKKTNR